MQSDRLIVLRGVFQSSNEELIMRIPFCSPIHMVDNMSFLRLSSTSRKYVESSALLPSANFPAILSYLSVYAMSVLQSSQRKKEQRGKV